MGGPFSVQWQDRLSMQIPFSEIWYERCCQQPTTSVHPSAARLCHQPSRQLSFWFISFLFVFAQLSLTKASMNTSSTLDVHWSGDERSVCPSLKRKHSRETETKKPCISETELYRDLNFWLFPFYLYILQCRSESETMTYRRGLSWHGMTLWPHHTELTKNGQLPLA